MICSLSPLPHFQETVGQSRRDPTTNSMPCRVLGLAYAFGSCSSTMKITTTARTLRKTGVLARVEVIKWAACHPLPWQGCSAGKDWLGGRDCLVASAAVSGLQADLAYGAIVAARAYLGQWRLMISSCHCGMWAACVAATADKDESLRKQAEGFTEGSPPHTLKPLRSRPCQSLAECAFVAALSYASHVYIVFL